MCFSLHSHLKSLQCESIGLCSLTVKVGTCYLKLPPPRCAPSGLFESQTLSTHLICGPVLKGKALETNNWLDTELILGFMSESLNVSHSSIINSAVSL